MREQITSTGGAGWRAMAKPEGPLEPTLVFVPMDREDGSAIQRLIVVYERSGMIPYGYPFPVLADNLEKQREEDSVFSSITPSREVGEFDTLQDAVDAFDDT